MTLHSGIAARRALRSRLRYTQRLLFLREPAMYSAQPLSPCLLALLGLSALGCSGPPPSALTEARVVDGAVQVSITHLTSLEQVTIAGQSAAMGETLTLPLSDFQIGPNRIPIEAEGLENASVYLDLKPTDLMTLRCDAPEGEGGSIQIFSETNESTFIQVDCAIEGLALEADLDLAAGFALEGEGITTDDGRLRIDLAAHIWSQPFPRGGRPLVRPPTLELPVTLSAEGLSWSGTLHADFRRDALGHAVADLPGSAAAMPPATDAWAARIDGTWWFRGSADQLGGLRYFVVEVERGAPFPMERCAFQEMAGGGSLSLAVTGTPVTYAALDRDGTELGRQLFTPSGCPAGASIEPGQTEIGVVPSLGQVERWMDLF